MVDVAAVMTGSAKAPVAVAERPAAAPGLGRDTWLYLLLIALVYGAWRFTQLGLYTTRSDTGYWLGVAGGVSMVLLFTYPMRKHFRFMFRWGAGKWWFVAHMVLGILGPVLILLHSNFVIGSLNAAVAFSSMSMVALSGIVGRFLYVRVHRNLHGERHTLDELAASLNVEHSASARLHFAPMVVERCRAFEAIASGRGVVTVALVFNAVVRLPWVRWRTEHACRVELRMRLLALAKTEGWSRREFRRRLRAARGLVHDYLAAAQRVGHFAAWDRLFSWWHIAHVPFVYMLVVSAIVHVVAVHAY
jgi:hypothetical protein